MNFKCVLIPCLSIAAACFINFVDCDLVPRHSIVKPGERFTKTCTSAGTELDHWKVGGVNFTTSHKNGSTHSITCFFGPMGAKVLKSVHCKTTSETWVQKQLPNDKRIPITLFANPYYCIANGVRVGSNVHIAMPPVAPFNVSCLLNGNTEIWCWWGIPEREEIGNEILDYSTKYNLTIRSLDSGTGHTEALECSTTRKTNFCSFQTPYLLLDNMNVIVTAWNKLGVASTSIQTMVARVTQPLTKLVVSNEDLKDFRNAKIRIEIGNVPLFKCYTYHYELQIQYSNAPIANVKFQQREKFAIWDEWKKYGLEAMYMRRSYEDFKFWKGSQSIKNFSCFSDLTIPAPGNTTVAVRGSLLYDDQQFAAYWSSYTDAVVLRTQVTAPQRPKLTVLWIKSGQAEKEKKSDIAVALWSTPTLERYRNVALREYVLNSSCPKAKDGRQTSLAACKVAVSGRNEIGDSNPAEVVLREDLHKLQNLTLEVVNSTTAAIRFEMSCNNCNESIPQTSENEVEIFFWPVSVNWYNLGSLGKQAQPGFQNRVWRINADSQGPYMKTLSNEENDKATLPTVSRKPDEPSPAIEDSQLRSLTVPFARGSGTEYSSYLTFSFKAFTAYKFAVALKADDRNIGPANELPSAYFFTTAAPKAEPHVKLNQIADDAIQVTWSDPPPDQWHGTIQGYTVYVSEDKMCGRRTRTTRKGNSCKYSCLSPERVENKSLHRQGDLGEDWKFQQTDLLKAVYGSYDHSSTIGGLQPGRMYYVRVSMWNKHGEGPCDAVEKIWWTREFSAASVVGICAGVVAFLIFFGAIITKRNKIRRTWCPKIPMPDFAPSLIIFDGRESEKFLEVGKETIDLLKNYKSTHGLSENEPKADTPFVVRSTAFKMQKLENCDKMSDDGIALKDDLMTNEDDFVSALKKTYGDRCICGSVDTLDSEGYTSPENALRISANQQRRRAQSAKDSGLATCSSTLDGNE